MQIAIMKDGIIVAFVSKETAQKAWLQGSSYEFVETETCPVCKGIGVIAKKPVTEKEVAK